MIPILLLEIKNAVKINNFDIFYKFFQNLEYLFCPVFYIVVFEHIYYSIQILISSSV